MEQKKKIKKSLKKTKKVIDFIKSISYKAQHRPRGWLPRSEVKWKH